MERNNEFEITEFLSNYDAGVFENGMALRIKLKKLLPGITEQLDVPAKMIAYCYGQRYIDMVCCMFPSKKGIKLSFYKGVDLPDPDKILKGLAKTTRYVEIKSELDIDASSTKQLIKDALKMYKERMKQYES